MSHAHDHDHDHSPQAGGHDHDHGSGHSHAPTVTNRNEKVVLFGFLLTFGFMIVELAGGMLSGSLALIADAGHMLTDSAALALAWAAFRFGRRRPDARRSFGYLRFEVLAGFVNAVTLLLLVGWIAYEAVVRLMAPAPVLAGPMLIVAVLGLVVNIGVFLLLRQGDQGHVNIRGALLHVLGDLLGSLGAIIAALVIWATGWLAVDPILSVLVSALILRSAWALLKSSLHILMEGTPPGLDPAALGRDLAAAVPGIAAVEHVHVWLITSGRAMATMTARLAAGADPAASIAALKHELAHHHDIAHSTVEIDWSGTGAACSIEPQGPGR